MTEKLLESPNMVFIFYSGDEQELEALDELTKNIPELQATLVIGSHLLKDKVLLPFIETPTGERFFGLDSIQEFCKTKA